MLARGLFSLHTLPLLGRKSSLVKSRVSITSKLIETKPLQVLYFGHLRKTGGWGSYQLCYATSGSPLPLTFANLSALLASALALLFSCPEVSTVGCWLTTVSLRNSFVSPTYAKTGGTPPCGKCRRADIFDFSPYFLRFLARLLRQRLLRGTGAPEVLPGFRQRVDGIVIFVAAIQRFRVVRFNARAVILRPVGNAQLPVVFLHLVHPALADKWHIANDARRGKPRQVTHDVVLQLLRFMDCQPPVFGVGNHVALIKVVRQDFPEIQQRKTK